MPREFENPVVTGGPFRLGDWLVEPSLNRLSRGDTTIQLELKVMDVLVCLAERAEEVVPRRIGNHEELIARLKPLTYLRVVRNQDSPTGWRLEVGPFPGWETVPTW